jgi:hypothetical protein
LILDLARGQQQVALSSCQNDSGLFEPSLNDERYLPFELKGVISEWGLEIPAKYQQFDYSTISDVIIHLRYTALLDDRFKDEVNNLITDAYNSVQPSDASFTGMAQRFDIRREFGDLWHTFISSPAASGVHELKIDLTKEHFPYLLRPLEVTVHHISLFCELDKALLSGQEVKFEIEAASPPSVTLSPVPDAPEGRYFYWAGTVGMQFIVPKSLVIRADSDKFPTADLKEFIVVVHFKISLKNLK